MTLHIKLDVYDTMMLSDLPGNHSRCAKTPVLFPTTDAAPSAYFQTSLFEENAILNGNKQTGDFFSSWATMHGKHAHDSGNLKVVTNVSHKNQVLCHIYNIRTFIR
jgi:hypothetical protein